MTPQEEMQKIVAAAGECWHEWIIESSTLDSKDILGGHCYGGHGYECACGFRRVNRVNWAIGDEANLGGMCRNPSPTDLNELFRLAEKLEFDEVRSDILNGITEIIEWGGKDRRFLGMADDPADALRNALSKAIEGREYMDFVKYENFADNGEFSHHTYIDKKTGDIVLSADLVDRLTKEKSDNHDRAEEIITARENEIKLLQKENAGLVERFNDLRDKAFFTNSEYKKCMAERARLRAALERLASPEAFVLAKMASPEETARMKFAAETLLYPQVSKAGL